MNLAQRIYEGFLKIVFSALSLIWVLATIIITAVLGICLGIIYPFDKRLFIVLVLMSVSTIASLGLYPLGFLFALFRWRGFRSYLLDVAITRDISGNVYCGGLLNATLLKEQKDYARFGNWFETISDNLGENKVINNLSGMGKALDKFLNLLDPNHSIKSIREDIKL